MFNKLGAHDREREKLNEERKEEYNKLINEVHVYLRQRYHITFLSFFFMFMSGFYESKLKGGDLIIIIYFFLHPVQWMVSLTNYV